MKRSDLEKVLLKELGSLHKSFEKNELAYVLLPSKTELHLRDKLAFHLHKRLAKEGLAVKREWTTPKRSGQRTDIAILKGNRPVALIELKVAYTFDLPSGNPKKDFTKDMLNDEKKALKVVEAGTQVYTVLFATHPSCLVPKNKLMFMTYGEPINKRCRLAGSADAVRQYAENFVKEGLSQRKVVASGSMAAGRAYGVYVDLLYWVVRAKR